jgi:kinesin family protein 3/17
MNEVISQAITQIYKSINVDKVHTYKVKYQYLQIYNEQCNDLLSDEPNKNLEIRENKNKSFFVQGLKQELVNNEFELKETLKDKGVNNRKTALTIKNHNSSRSHSILTIILEATEGVTTRTSKLNLVDLAGSESQKNTSASRSLLKEGEKINSSLSVLGRVIRALADNDEHIPYRDSKLTQLLKDSVGGNTKILMIAAISPACYNESLLTLNFAKSVKDIKNKAIKNIATLSTSTTTSTVKMEIFKKKFEDERKKPIESESKVEELQKKLIESESNEELQKKVGVSTIEVECYTIDQIKDDDQTQS